MDSFPIFLQLKSRKCLVVGSNEAAFRKASALLACGAVVDLIGRDFTPDLQQLITAQNLSVVAETFTEQALEGYVLVIASGEDEATDKAVYTAATARNMLVNVVDKQHYCAFITPAIVDRSPLLIAISSNGVAPVLARHVRSLIEVTIPASFARLAQLSAAFREKSKQLLPNFQKRRLFWEKVFTGTIAEKIFIGEEKQAETLLEQALQAEALSDTAQGEVYIVGAGPGDPDLLTFKALRCMQKADVVVYDRLVSPEILALCRRDAEKIYAGKQRANHCLPQDEINALLIEKAREGKRVVRLKGGDPFMFGRGGEEVAAVTKAGIPCVVVAGITAALGCAAAVGVPLTHRDYAQSCVFVTGHLKSGELSLPWQKLVDDRQTIVVYMGKVTLNLIAENLIKHGLSPDTPAMLIANGTTPQQQVITATLATLPERATALPDTKAALLIIGHVIGASLEEN